MVLCLFINLYPYVYSGSAFKPAVTVLDGTKKLVKNTDYTVKYSSNKNVGTATVTITGKGSYHGSVKKTFKIVPKATTLSLPRRAAARERGSRFVHP